MQKTNWVLVETIQMFRHQYLVEAPVDHPEYAEEALVFNQVDGQELNELTQKWLGETCTGSRVVTAKEAYKILHEDNPFCKDMSIAQKETLYFNFRDYA